LISSSTNVCASRSRSSRPYLAGPYLEQLRRSLGVAAGDAGIAAEPEHALATLGEVLLTPTRIYARAVLGLRDALDAAGLSLAGVAHITGGGLPGNLPRALPAGLGARIDPTRWRMPSIMHLLGALGSLDGQELRATFNGGIGMAIVVSRGAAGPALAHLADAGLEAWRIGEVVPEAELGGLRYAEGALTGGDA
jgi:phosphoribosylformylglycinamidine cyclo-ligase